MISQQEPQVDWRQTRQTYTSGGFSVSVWIGVRLLRRCLPCRQVTLNQLIRRFDFVSSVTARPFVLQQERPAWPSTSLRTGQFVMNRTGAILAGGGEYEPLPKRPKVESRSSPEALALSKLHRREKDWRAKELVFPQQLISPTKNVSPRGRASGQTSWGVC